MNVYSWNTLHMIHELNHVQNSPICLAWNFYDRSCLTSEKNRIKAIMLQITGMLDSKKNTALCLQEVSGDLLLELQLFEKDFDIYWYKHTRIPRLDHHLVNLIDNPYVLQGEYLVTLVSKALGSKPHSFLQYGQPGKAALVVEIPLSPQSKLSGGQLLINTHISIVANGKKQLRWLLECYAKENVKKIIVGDYNKTRKELVTDLFISPSFREPETGLTTHMNGTCIDHILIDEATGSAEMKLCKITLVDQIQILSDLTTKKYVNHGAYNSMYADKISDHYPIRAIVT